MKITIYELLGLIKDGKAPKKIKFEFETYFYDEEYHDYTDYDREYGLFSDKISNGYGVVAYLNDEVEIIEELTDEEKAVRGWNKYCEAAKAASFSINEKKYNKIEKLDIRIQDERTGNAYIINEYGTKCYLTKHSKILATKINEIIDKLNEMEDK